MVYVFKRLYIKDAGTAAFVAPVSQKKLIIFPFL
jgi:hypothetical protein